MAAFVGRHTAVAVLRGSGTASHVNAVMGVAVMRGSDAVQCAVDGNHCRRLSTAAPRATAHSAPSYDVVVVGGGVVGSSTAMHLTKMDPKLSVLVLERDTSYRNASAMLSVGGIRQQFSNEENVRLALDSAKIMKHFAEYTEIEPHDQETPRDVQLTEKGYLMFATNEEGAKVLRSNYELQNSCGAVSDLLNHDQVAARFPYMNSDDILLAVHGTKYEGWLDPWLLLHGYRSRATRGNVKYAQGQACGLTLDGPADRRPTKITGVEYTDKAGVKHRVNAGIVVNAAGAWCAPIASWAGVTDFPVAPRVRSVFVAHSPAATYENFPMLVDVSGAFARREGNPSGGRFVCGRSPYEHQDGDLPIEFNVHEHNPDHSQFENDVWPFLAERVPVLEEMRVQSAWVGFYEYNRFDQNALIGYHRDCKNMVFANGFSGHGMMQSPATGRGVAELILYGGYKSIDLKRLRPDRYRDNDPIIELNVV